MAAAKAARASVESCGNPSDGVAARPAPRRRWPASRFTGESESGIIARGVKRANPEIIILSSKGKTAPAPMTLTCIKWISAPLCAAVLVALPAAAQPSPSDADLAAAREAVQKGRWKAIEQLKPRFAGTLLEAYPDYWLLDGNIDHADPSDVRAFLAKYPSGPLAESLRRDWLKALGASASWELFRAEYPRLLFDDAETTCYAFQERFARADPEVVPEARSLFLEGHEAPSACDPVFAALAARGDVSEADIWSRIRKLLAAGHAKAAARANELLPSSHRM